MPTLPAWLQGCILATSPYAGPGYALVADCTVIDSHEPRRKLLNELVDLLSDLTNKRLQPETYSVEDMKRMGYRINKAKLANGGEARIVEYQGRLLNAAAVLPGLAAEGLERVGDPLEPPIPGSPSGGQEQPILARPPVYTAEGATPRHEGVVVLHAAGRQYQLSLQDIASMAEEVRLPLHCVTGWTTWKTWKAARLSTLLTRVGLLVSEGWALAISAGGYSAVMPANLLQEAWLAVEMDGVPLPPEHGGPVRLILPSLYGWKHVKWVTRIEILNNYVDGYWEARGYHEIGEAAKGERFKLRNPALLDKD